MKSFDQENDQNKNISGKRIREARMIGRTVVTQVQLVRKLAVKGIIMDQGALSKIERGERFVTDYELLAISRCLKVSVGWLCGERAKKAL